MAEGSNIEDLMGSLNSFMNNLRTNEEEDRDENGNVVASRILDAQGNVLFSHQYTYDESGRRLSHDSFKDGKLKSREEISYDENGFKTTKYFDGNNVPQRIVRLDDKGRQVGQADYDLQGNLESFSSQTYKENGEENETVSYEMIHGKIRISAQTFCDDNGTRHIRSYRNDEVTMSYQTKDLRFPNQVWVPTKDDWSRDREAAEEHLNAYKAEEAFFKSKPEPKMDAWVASFGERETHGKNMQMTDSEGFNHMVSYDDDGRVVADEKYDQDGKLVGEGIYENGEFKGSKAYSVDDEGFSHVVVKDEQNRPVSDQKFDKDGKLAGEGIYENGEFKGSKAYSVDDKGFSHVAVKDEQKRPVSDQKFDKDGKLVGEGVYENGEFKGRKEYRTDGKGLNHTIVFDLENKVLSDQAFDKDGNLRGEGIYENGQFRGTKEYLKDDKGLDHVVTRNRSGRIVSEQKFDKDGRQVMPDNTKQAKLAEEVKQAAPEKTVEEKRAEPVREEQKVEPAEEVKQAEPEKTVEKYNQYVDAAGLSHFVTRDENGQMLADRSFDKDGNTQSDSYYKNGVLDSKTIYNEDGSKHSFFYENDGSVRSEKFVSADGRSVSSIAHTSGMTTTELLDEQGRTAYTVSYYNDGGKLYPWNEHSYAYDADGKQTDDQVRSFGTDGEKGGKTSEELLASLQHKDEWLMQTFADRVSGRVTAEEAQKTAEVANTAEEKQAEPVREEQKAEPAEEVKQAEPEKTVEEKQAEPVREEQTVEPAEEVKQAEPEKAEKDKQMTDSEGFNHTVSYDDDGRVVADKKYDKDGKLVGEGIYENGEFKGSKMYSVDDEGFSHVAVKDEQNRPVSDQKFDKDGKLVGEGIYENGAFKGRKEYRTDDKGRKHAITFDVGNTVLSDQAFDKDGNLVGEGIYENGQFRGTKEYLKDDKGLDHVVTRNRSGAIISEQKFDKDGREVTPNNAKQTKTAEEVKQAEPEKTVEEKQAEQVAESDVNVNTITSGSEEQTEQVAESDTYVNTITSGSEEREEKQSEQVFDENGRLTGQTLYDNTGRVSGSVEYAYSDDGSISMYTYDADGQQTGFDGYDAEGHRKYASDFRDGVQQNFVRFDDEGRPTSIDRYNEGQPAVSTSIQYDGDTVYKDVRSADGQLLRSETTSHGRMSIVDYVDQKARTFYFEKDGAVDELTDYTIQDGKAVKSKDAVFDLSYSIGERQVRFYDSDGRITEGFIRDNEGVDTNYSFSKDGSYKESGPNGDKTHHAIRLFGKTVRTPSMPDFWENKSDEIPLAVDGDNHPQLSEQELACFRQGYDEIGEGVNHIGCYSEKLPCVYEGVSRTKLFTQAADRLAQVGGVKREASNDGSEQAFVNTIENGGDEQTAENTRQNGGNEQNAERQAQTADARVPSEWEKSVNENMQEEVCVAENGDEKNTSKGLGEDDLMKQGQNLRQWINYFGMEGSRAKPPYASPFEKVTACRELQGLALADLANGNTVINSSKRLELVVRSKEGEKKEPTLDECMTLVRLGQQKGWTSIRITGSPAFQKQMYLACRSLGMPTKDFVPTPEMLKEAADLENAFNSKDKLLPQSAEDKEAGKPEMREPTLKERCADLDDRFHALEKVRESQPAREQTAEDPYPDLANFDTIRAAEKLGIRPITAVEKEPADLDGKLKVLDKRSNDALDNLMQTEKNRKETLFHTAEAAQRGEWRDQLSAVLQKEQGGQALSDEDNRVKAMADKYQINADPALEPETVPVIDRADFDLKNEKALRKKEIGVEVGSAFAAAVVRREAATNAASLIASDSAEIPATKDLLATAKKELKQIAGTHQPISETMRQIGNIKAQTVQQTEQNKQNYNGVTKRKMRDNRQATEASKKLDARVVAAASQRDSR